jgi:hypothetical protein
MRKLKPKLHIKLRYWSDFHLHTFFSGKAYEIKIARHTSWEVEHLTHSEDRTHEILLIVERRNLTIKKDLVALTMNFLKKSNHC